MQSRPSYVLVLATALVTLVLAARPPVAAANPEKVFAGKIIVSDKRFPTKAKSPAAYVGLLRKQSKTSFMEDKANKTWHIYYAAFFRKPLADIEVVVKLYDVGSAGRPMIASFEQYLSERGGKSLLSDFTLDRKLVGANHDVQMVLEVGGQVVATGKFKILGEVERLSGKVDFSEDETDDE
jgi:hypothetical protein